MLLDSQDALLLHMQGLTVRLESHHYAGIYVKSELAAVEQVFLHVHVVRTAEAGQLFVGKRGALVAGLDAGLCVVVAKAGLGGAVRHQLITSSIRMILRALHAQLVDRNARVYDLFSMRSERGGGFRRQDRVGVVRLVWVELGRTLRNLYLHACIPCVCERGL